MSIDQIDIKTVTMEQLEGLTLEQLLANNIGEYNLSSNLSDGVYFGYIEAYEAKHFPVDLPDPGRGDQVSHGARRADAEGSGAGHRPPEPRL